MRWLIWLALTATSLNSAALAGDPPKNFKPVVVWTGTDSGQTKASVARCVSKDQWQATWKAHEHEGGEAGRLAPEVDFERYMVLAVFQGENVQNHGLFHFEVMDETDCLRVRYVTGYFQTAGHSDSEADKRRLETQSYAFLVLPKSSKAIVFEEAKDVRARTGWVEQGRIAADTRK
jgi:hypothetical protein